MKPTVKVVPPGSTQGADSAHWLFWSGPPSPSRSVIQAVPASFSKAYLKGRDVVAHHTRIAVRIG